MKIKSTIVLATAAGAALTPNAADAQTRGRGMTMPAAPVFTWTGFYVGGHLGYAWQKNTTTGAYLDPPNTYQFTNSSDPRGSSAAGRLATIGRTAVSCSASKKVGHLRSVRQRYVHADGPPTPSTIPS